MSVADVTTQDLREYIAWLRDQTHAKSGEKLSDSTVNSYIRGLHRFFAWCADEYACPNPMKRIAFPKEKPMKPKAIDLDDLKAMLAECKEDFRGIRNRAMMLFLIDTGCRVGGLVGLNREDVDLSARYATVTEKGNKTRRVRFSQSTSEALQAWLALRFETGYEGLYVFYSYPECQQLTTDGVRVILSKLGKLARVQGRVNPHSFRHAFAREYLIAGGDLATLSLLMGHTLPQTTVNSYARFTEQELAERFDQFAPTNRLKGK
jgi:integrase/recombinase XerD